eukprot:7172431-Prymnesium_polylepis.1
MCVCYGSTGRRCVFSIANLDVDPCRSPRHHTTRTVKMTSFSRSGENVCVQDQMASRKHRNASRRAPLTSTRTRAGRGAV